MGGVSHSETCLCVCLVLRVSGTEACELAVVPAAGPSLGRQSQSNPQSLGDSVHPFAFPPPGSFHPYNVGAVPPACPADARPATDTASTVQ